MRTILFTLLCLVLVLPVRAQEEPSEAEMKLRENLRNTMIQLRDAQGQVATLQGTQLQNERTIKTLETDLAKSKKKASDDGATAAAHIEELEKTVAGQDARNAKQVEALGKWKQSYEQLAGLARTTEANRAQLANEKILLQRKVDEQARTNRKLYEIGVEILDRYERFGLGDALTAREPFVGTTRVKFQNLVQDYGDQLSENKIRE